jgi:hypothetical protein
MPNQISYICALIGIVGGHVLISEMPVMIYSTNMETKK